MFGYANCEKRVQRMKQIVDCCISHNKEIKKVVIENVNAIFDIETVLTRLLVVQISSSTNGVMYLRFSSKS